MKSYASLDALKAVLSLPGESTSQDDRLALALVAATAWVDFRIGVEPADTIPGDFDADDLAVEPEAPAGVRLATIAAAVRFTKSPDVPFGVAGGLGDMAVHVSRSIPEAELLLTGHHESWGIA